MPRPELSDLEVRWGLNRKDGSGIRERYVEGNPEVAISHGDQREVEGPERGEVAGECDGSKEKRVTERLAQRMERNEETRKSPRDHESEVF